MYIIFYPFRLFIRVDFCIRSLSHVGFFVLLSFIIFHLWFFFITLPYLFFSNYDSLRRRSFSDNNYWSPLLSNCFIVILRSFVLFIPLFNIDIISEIFIKIIFCGYRFIKTFGCYLSYFLI